MTIERKVGIAYSIRFTVGAVLYSVGVLVGLRWAVVVRLGDSFSGTVIAGGDCDGFCVTGDRRAGLLVAGS